MSPDNVGKKKVSIHNIPLLSRLEDATSPREINTNHYLVYKERDRGVPVAHARSLDIKLGM